MRHHHQRPAVHPLTQPGFGRVRRSNSTSIRSTKRPRSARAPLGRCSRATSRSSRPSSISMPGLSPGPIRYRPGCLKAHSNRLRASATASGHRYSASTRRTAARVRADTPEIRRTGRCLGGRHRSARTAFGRLRGIALSDQNHGGILPRSAPSERGNRPDPLSSGSRLGPTTFESSWRRTLPPCCPVCQIGKGDCLRVSWHRTLCMQQNRVERETAPSRCRAWSAAPLAPRRRRPAPGIRPTSVMRC